MCTLIHCSYAQQTLPSAINTYKNANKTFTNVLKYVHECQHAAGNVSQGTWGSEGRRGGAVTEQRVENSGNSRHSVTKLTFSQGYDLDNLDDDVTAGAFYRDHDQRRRANPVLIEIQGQHISSRSDDPIKPRETNIKFRRLSDPAFYIVTVLRGLGPELLAGQKIFITPQNAKPCAETETAHFDTSLSLQGTFTFTRF